MPGLRKSRERPNTHQSSLYHASLALFTYRLTTSHSRVCGLYLRLYLVGRVGLVQSLLLPRLLSRFSKVPLFRLGQRLLRAGSPLPRFSPLDQRCVVAAVRIKCERPEFGVGPSRTCSRSVTPCYTASLRLSIVCNSRSRPGSAAYWVR